jgi:O-Antigen ligase
MEFILCVVFLTICFAYLYIICTKPQITLLIFAGVNSLTALSIQVVINLYLTRVAALAFLISLLIKSNRGLAKKPRIVADKNMVMLFLLQMGWQLITLQLVSDIPSGLTRMSSYIFLMLEFSITYHLSLGNLALIDKSLWIFLWTGALQGLHGVYQIIGLYQGWPMLLTYLDALPSVNERYRMEAMIDEHGSLRAFSTFGDPNIYAGYLVAVLMFLLNWLIRRNRIDKNVRYMSLIIMTIMIILGMLLSGSRSAFLALVAGLITTIVVWMKEKEYTFGFRLKRIFLRPAIIGSLFLLMFLAVSSLNILPSELNIVESWSTRLSGLQSILFQDGNSYSESLQGHKLTRLLGLEIFMRNPIMGCGIGNFGSYYSQELRYSQVHSHSHFLDTLAETGLVGSFIEWSIILYVLYTVYRGISVSKKNSSEKVWLSGLFSSIVTIVMGNFGYMYYLQNFVWFELAIGLSLSQMVIKSSLIEKQSS